MKKLTKITSPSYVKGFKCIGGDCEDSCCIGWDIDIDKITYRRYFRTKDPLMKQDFVKHVYRNDDCDSDEVDYGRVRINESKWCPFLDNNKLCRIYSNLGEDYLSNVCYSYPRVYNVLDDDYELSLFMSCPEAIRKLMSNREPIKFIEEEVVLEKHILHYYVDTRDNKWNKLPIRRLKELRTMSIAMIQDRKHNMTDRLLKLGFKIENLSSQEKTRNTKKLKVLNNAAFQIGFFKDAIQSLDVLKEIDSPVFVDLTKKIMNEFRLDEDIPIVEKSTLYKEAVITIIDPFLEENGHLFEHYLVNFMFQANFPFTESLDMFDGFLMLVVRYSFIRFYLAGIASAEGEITEEDVILMIQVYTKTIDHHKTFIMDLLEEIKEKDFDNMQFISTLLE